MSAPCETTHLLLQAELDGELDAAAAAGLSDHLSTCPDCATLRTDLTALSTQLRTGLTRYAAPASLVSAVAASIPAAKPERRTRRTAWSHAASFGAGLAIAASVMLAIRPAAEPGALSDLVTAHIRALQPGHLLDVTSTDQHTVKPWFDGRVAFAPAVMDLAAKGFPLLGGRLDSLDGPPVAALVYGRRQHLIDVFIKPGSHSEPSATLQGYNTIGWTQGGLVYQAVSDLNATELADFAQLMQAPAP
jgi:anti-sigma factor RsiW